MPVMSDSWKAVDSLGVCPLVGIDDRGPSDPKTPDKQGERMVCLIHLESFLVDMSVQAEPSEESGDSIASGCRG